MMWMGSVVVQVAGFQEGDWVVPIASGQGTWRQLARWPSQYWHVVPNTLPLEAAATISVKCDPTLGAHLSRDGKTVFKYIAPQARYCLPGMLTSPRGFVAPGPHTVKAGSSNMHIYVMYGMRCSLHSHLEGCSENLTSSQ